MKKHTIIKTSEMPKDEREWVIDLYLLMFFNTEDDQLQLISHDELVERVFDEADWPKVERGIKLFIKYRVDAILVDDATEKN